MLFKDLTKWIWKEELEERDEYRSNWQKQVNDNAFYKSENYNLRDENRSLNDEVKGLEEMYTQVTKELDEGWTNPFGWSRYEPNFKAINGLKVPLNTFITINDKDLKRVLINRGFNNLDIKRTALKLESWIFDILKYRQDRNASGIIIEDIRSASYIFKSRADDCLEENTLIYCLDKKNNLFEKKIKDIKVGEYVLSYNFKEQIQEPKKVLKVWNKGRLDGLEISLGNKTSFIATPEHKLFIRKSQKDKQDFKIQKISDIDLTKWWKKQTYVLNKLNYGNVNVSNDFAYLTGIYIAEGWCCQGKVCIGQDKEEYKIKIENCLKNLNIPYSKSKRQIHHSFTILKSEFKEHLKSLGSNSFDMKMPKDILNWDIKSTEKFIEGLLDGDGYYCKNGKFEWEYSTSSDYLAENFMKIIKKVYGNCYKYHQLNHGGVGKKPIWRINFNKNSLWNDNTFNDVGRVNIQKIEEIGEYNFFDISVEDNNNFILSESGLISHNCDGHAILFQACMHILGFGKECVVKFDNVEMPGFKGGHAYNKVLIDDEWIVFDPTNPKKVRRVGVWTYDLGYKYLDFFFNYYGIFRGNM